MKALTYFIPLAEKIRSLEIPTSRNFKHARVVPSFFENLKKITLETVRITLGMKKQCHGKTGYSFQKLEKQAKRN